MKKKILGLAIVALSVTSLPSIARTPGSDACPAQKGCTTTCKTDCKADCTTDCHGSCPTPCTDSCRDGKERRPGHRNDPFAGLSLTDSQKEQLRQLRAKRDTTRVKMAQARKTKRLHNDSLRMATSRADRKQYLEDVKAIIGSDQYVTYLENLVLDAPQGAGHHRKPQRHNQPKNVKADNPRQTPSND